jgi:hypothetical protein
LKDGQRQLTYQETITSKAGETGQLTFPDELTFGVRQFQGTLLLPVEPLRAKLRYRIHDGNLSIGFVLVRYDEWRQAAFDQVAAQITTALASVEVTVLAGHAPDPVVSPLVRHVQTGQTL